MDLTQLYNLTTPELRDEAERLGVTDTYALSRAQLINAIRIRVGGAPPEGFLGRVLGFAKWALKTTAPHGEPAAENKGDGHGAEEVETKRFTRPSEIPAGSAAGSAAVPVSAAVPAAAAAPVTVPAAAPVSPPATESVPVPVLTPTPTPPPRKPSEREPSRAPAGVFSGAATTYEEPFPTRTMARILADQGHYKRSLAIYATLLRDGSNDPELRREAEAVRAQSRSRRPHIQ